MLSTGGRLCSTFRCCVGLRSAVEYFLQLKTWQCCLRFSVCLWYIQQGLSARHYPHCEPGTSGTGHRQWRISATEIRRGSNDDRAIRETNGEGRRLATATRGRSQLGDDSVECERFSEHGAVTVRTANDHRRGVNLGGRCDRGDSLEQVDSKRGPNPQ